jgi:hypothetical protein
VRRGAGGDGGRAIGVPGWCQSVLKLKIDIMVQKKWGCCYENGEFYYIKVDFFSGDIDFFFLRWGEDYYEKSV